MAEPKITLEDYLRQYLDNQAIKNEKLGFAEYGRKYQSDYVGKYNDAITRMLEKEKRATLATGVAGERLGDAGLEDSGYARYIRSGLTPDLTEERKNIEAELMESQRRAESDYNDYEMAYDINQEELRSEVVDRLLANGVTDPTNAYAYAIEAGLSKSNAKSVSLSITATTRDKLKQKLLDGLFNRTLSAESAYALAKLYGVPDDELDELKKQFEWYKVNHTEIPEDFLDYLTELSTYFNPTTGTTD